jgi:hypothetical protein
MDVTDVRRLIGVDLAPGMVDELRDVDRVTLSKPGDEIERVLVLLDERAQD